MTLAKPGGDNQPMFRQAAFNRTVGLSFWRGTVNPELLGSGEADTIFIVVDKAKRYLVRITDDIPVAQIMRTNEVAASEAAYAAGLSPAVLYREPGVVVMEYLEAKPLDRMAICDEATLKRIVPLLRKCHRDMPLHLRGPILMFWVFHVLRDYAAKLHEAKSQYRELLASLAKDAENLSIAVGQIEVVFGHNDLVPTSFLDDGRRLWLIDWDYAGFNSPLFDLGGLASNNGLTEAQERWLLEAYFCNPLTDAVWRSFNALK